MYVLHLLFVLVLTFFPSCTVEAALECKATTE